MRGRGTGDHCVANREGKCTAMSVWVGIDVAARSVEMVWRSEGKSSKSHGYEQTAAGHTHLIKELRRLEPSCVVLEATGIYYLDLALAMDEAGLPVAVINPKSARRFTELKLERTKTDRVDAALLAEYAERLTPERWRAPTSEQLALRDVGRQINRLNAARVQAKNRLHALLAKRGTLPVLIEDERDGIARLEQRIDKLKQAGLELVSESAELSQQMQCLTAACGVAKTTALSLLAEFCVLPRQLKAPQVSRHAGMDVRLYESGTSVKRPGRLSKAGNAYLRAALYLPAMSAIQHDARAKAFYTALVARGKKKMQALCAVMRKYLTGLWVCFIHKVPFDSARLFDERHLADA
jgi:transposase